jgi:4-hydroxy-tetrahydrodipicolinate reductase
MKIALIGYGKMGKEIEKKAIERGHKILFKFDVENASDFTVENLKKADVAIEFTQPESAYANFMKCFEAGVKVVSGTTGWLDKFSEIKDRCKTDGKTFFYASNFSIGVNILFKLNKQLVELMNQFPGYTASITETHHVQKKDAPSGTAVTLAQDILTKSNTHKKITNEIAVDNTELAVHSIRMGDVPGIHTIRYESDVDCIELTHHTKNRKGLAEGAVLAAEYAYTHKGFLTMNDLLGI